MSIVRVAGFLVAASVGVVPAVPVAFAASPTPSAPPVGDPRSSGQGPGLVGDPLFAIGVVALIGIASLVVALAYVRATGGTRRP